jgi:phosphoribosylglycinamide formyltransferase-1
MRPLWHFIRHGDERAEALSAGEPAKPRWRRKEAAVAKKIRLGALISGGGTNLQAILDACAAGEIDAQAVFVGSDNPEALGLKRAAKFGIPTFVVNYKDAIRAVREADDDALLPADFELADLLEKQRILPKDATREQAALYLKTRVLAESRLLDAMRPYPFDLLVLAGFMRNLTPYFIDRVNTDRSRPRIMNIHPALLPAFPGTDGYGDTFRYGCKVGGCTAHFVDYGEDSGPIIGQRAFAIHEADTLDTIRKRGLELEWQLYPACIQLFAQDRLKTERVSHALADNRVYERTVVRILPK